MCVAECKDFVGVCMPASMYVTMPVIISVTASVMRSKSPVKIRECFLQYKKKKERKKELLHNLDACKELSREWREILFREISSDHDEDLCNTPQEFLCLIRLRWQQALILSCHRRKELQRRRRRVPRRAARQILAHRSDFFNFSTRVVPFGLYM